MQTIISKPIVLIVLDGWGHREEQTDNAIALAKTPTWDLLWHNYPKTLISGSGLDVGLPDGQMGNSEVGHITLGSGRVIYQDLTEISRSITNGTFNKNPVFLQAIADNTESTAIHIIGLLSDGGIHSHEEHIFALIKLLAEHKVKNFFVHAILDGRDTPPQSARANLIKLESLLKNLQCGKIASIAGRFYTMDRDKRYERTELAYNLMTTGETPYTATDAITALDAAYARGETDEFVKPTLLLQNGIIKDDDSVIFMNYRSDRARQLSYALTVANFSGFKRKIIPKLKHYITLTEYADDIKASVAFPKLAPKNCLGEYLELLKLKQLRISETEKYAHVTFFFNGGREAPFEGEDRILINSPKVATYDLEPAMSAHAITEELTKAILKQTYDVIICNYANADMVGHTGNLQAAIQAIEVLDSCINKIITALNNVGGAAIITADHGNAEMMFDEATRQPHTAHTTQLVPFVYYGAQQFRIAHDKGTLADIAPTILYLLGVTPPAEMTGTSLLCK